MSKQVPWNEDIYMEFCKLGMLSSDEREILRMRIMEYSIQQIALTMRKSVSTVNRIIAKLKVKYDKVQPLSDKLPIRKESAKETWMDTH